METDKATQVVAKPIQYKIFDYSPFINDKNSNHYNNMMAVPYKRRKCHVHRNPKLWRLNRCDIVFKAFRIFSSEKGPSESMAKINWARGIGLI